MRRLCLALLSLVLGAGVARADAAPTPASDDASRKKIRMVVTDFDVAGIPDRTARIVADNLVAELRKLEGASVVGMSEVRAMLAAESDREVMGCSENSCLAELADALGADVLVTGRLAVLDGATVFSMRRIDQAKAQVVGTVEQRLAAAGGSEMLAAVGPAVAQLFPEMALKPGASRGVPKEKALVLDPPPLPPWSTLAVAGGAATVVGVAGVFGVLAGQGAAAAQQLVNDSAATPEKGATVVAQIETAKSLALAANVSFGVAGALALGAGVMALFTDWAGYGDADALQ